VHRKTLYYRFSFSLFYDYARAFKKLIFALNLNFEVIPLTDALFLSGPPSAGVQNARLHEQLAPDYQRLSAVQTVTDGEQRSYELAGLKPGTLYAIVVAPFADNVDGAASNTVYLQTSEDGQYTEAKKQFELLAW